MDIGKILWQLEINRRLQCWRKNPPQCYDTVIVQRTKYQELWKGLYVNCCDFFYAEDFVRRIGIMLNITPLRSPDIFYNRASISQTGKILRWNRMRATQRNLWVFTACKQLKNRGIKFAFILVVVRPTVVQNSFHIEFLSSIKFSPLRLLRRWKRTRNFLTFSSGRKEELKLSLPTTKAN